MYTKITDLDNKITSLTFYKCDMFLFPRDFGRTFQRCEMTAKFWQDKELIKGKFKRVIYTFGNEYAIKKYIILDFNFEDSEVKINGKLFKITQSSEFIYKKLQGNKIGCINGIQGFYEHIVYCIDYDSPFNYHMLCTLEKWSKKEAINYTH